MLKNIVEKGIFSFHDHFDSWEDAIKASYEPMKAVGIVNDHYVQLVIDCVHKFGPYIVIAPNIAMPHSTEGAEGVFDTAIGFMKVEQPVHFDPNDSEKDACLFFALAAVDHEQHLQNMMTLSEMLMNEEIVEALLKVKTKADLLAIAERFQLN